MEESGAVPNSCYELLIFICPTFWGHFTYAGVRYVIASPMLFNTPFYTSINLFSIEIVNLL